MIGLHGIHELKTLEVSKRLKLSQKRNFLISFFIALIVSSRRDNSYYSIHSILCVVTDHVLVVFLDPEIVYNV